MSVPTFACRAVRRGDEWSATINAFPVHRRRFVPAVGLPILALVAIASGRPPAAMAQGATGGGSSYALVDTWRDRPYVPSAGRVAEPVDVTSFTDGRTVILDARFPATLHVLPGDGGAGTVAPLPLNMQVGRLDAGPDGTLAILSDPASDNPEVFVVEVDGRVRRRIALPAFEHLDKYTDIAVGADGRLYLAENDGTTSEEPDASARIVVLKPDGDVDRIVDLHRWLPVDHSLPGHAHPRIGAIDIGPDGGLVALLKMVGCT